MRCFFRLLFPVLLLALYCSSAFGLRIVTYNTATSGDNMSRSLPRERVPVVLEGIGNEVVDGISRPLDVLLLQEQDELATTTQAIVDLLNEIYGDGVYARGRRTARSNGGGRGGIVFNTQTVELVTEVSIGTLSASAQARETMRYTFRPLGYDEDANLFAYVNHYKAGSTSTDQTRRNIEAIAVRSNADRLEEGSHVIFAGDYNIRSCNEAMFQTLTAAGTTQAIDPINVSGTNCNWHNSNSHREWHTQSPSDGADSNLAQGGMDDRFDFQLVNDDLLNGEGLSIIPGTYRTFGNNGTHTLNQPVNDRFNTAAPRTVLNALARTSDHLPVVADYQIPAWMEVTTSAMPSRIIQGTPTTIAVDVANIAPVLNAIEADELDYELVFEIDTPDNATSFVGEVPATATEQIALDVPTDEVRNRVFRLRAVSDSEAVVDGEFQTSGFYSVFAPAVPSLSSEQQLTQQTIDLGYVALTNAMGPAIDIPVEIHNLAAFGLSAGLEFDSATVSAESDAITFEWDPFELLLKEESHSFSAMIESTQLGEHSSTLEISVWDDRSILGAQSSLLSVTVTARVTIPGDANGDDRVEFDDFLVLSRNFGNASNDWTEGDFDRDGLIAFGDFLMLSRNFGTSVAASVPEPTAVLPALVGLLCAFRSYRRQTVVRR